MADELAIKTRFLDFKLEAAPNGQMYVVGYNPNEPNIALQNIRIPLENLRNFFLTGIPVSPGKWVTQPSITVVDNLDGTVNIQVSAGSADWNGVVEPYDALTYPNIALPASPLQQLVAIAAKADGTYEYKADVPSQNPTTPALSTGALLVNYVLLNSDGAAVTQPDPTWITQEQVQALLGDYLPLVNPQGNAVAWGDAFKGGLHLNADGSFSLESDTAKGFYLDGMREGPTNTSAGTASFTRLIASHALNQQAGLLPYAKADGHGVLLFVKKPDGTLHELDFRSDGQLYLNGAAFTGGSSETAETIKTKLETLTGTARLDASAIKNLPSGGTLYTARGQETNGAPTNKLLDDELKKLEPTTSTLTLNSGSVTVPMSKDNFYTIASQPTTINIDISTNVLGAGVVVKFPANGTAEPTVNGAFKHANSGAFKATNGTTNHLRLFCEPNVTGAKTNYYIWT